jgi:hypothetical protein
MPTPSRITLPQVLALMAIWTAVIYSLTAPKPASEVEQISLKTRVGATACVGGPKES